MAAGELEIRLLGPLRVLRAGQELPLPPSKKTRALLAYLVATGRPQRRDRLCELLWDAPDDPRAALRWSLSRLRKVLNVESGEHLFADRAQVEFVAGDAHVDVRAVGGRTAASLTPEEAAALVPEFRGEFIEGLELPDSLEFSAWRAAERDEARKRLATLLQRSLEGTLQSGVAVRYARRLVELRPDDASAHAALVRLLVTDGRVSEARERLAAAKAQIGPGRALAPVLEAFKDRPADAGGGPAAGAPAGRDARSKAANSDDAAPALAVLPFNNMSGDPAQAFFADGMCEDIITDLARTRLFPVIARNSSFAFKGAAFDIRDVAAQLGATYVVEGSVRRAADTLRVTAQLIDARTGHHVWANRYDRPVDDIFALQDEIVQQICGALRPEVVQAEQEYLRRAPPASLGAWQEMLLGMLHFARTSVADVNKVVEHCERALELDPRLAEAHGRLACNEIWRVIFDFPPGRAAALAKALEHGHKATALDPENALAKLSLGWASSFFGKHEEAQALVEDAVRGDPSNAFARASLGALLVRLGQVDGALREIDAALRLSPRDHLAHFFYSVQSAALYLRREFGAAAAAAARGIASNPDAPFGHFNRAAALAQLGRDEEAAEAYADGCIARPDPDEAFFRAGWPYEGEEHTALWLQGIGRAGAPVRFDA